MRAQPSRTVRIVYFSGQLVRRSSRLLVDPTAACLVTELQINGIIVEDVDKQQTLLQLASEQLIDGIGFSVPFNAQHAVYLYHFSRSLADPRLGIINLFHNLLPASSWKPSASTKLIQKIREVEKGLYDRRTDALRPTFLSMPFKIKKPSLGKRKSVAIDEQLIMRVA